MCSGILAPPAVRGRVMGVWNMALPGLNPITALGAGALADRYSPSAALATSGAAVLVLALAAGRGLARAVVVPRVAEDATPGASPP